MAGHLLLGRKGSVHDVVCKVVWRHTQLHYNKLKIGQLAQSVKCVTIVYVISWWNNSDLMPVISCLTSLTFCSLFHVISIPFCPKTRLGATLLKNNSLCISLVRQIGFPIHFISVAPCCPLVLIEDITQMWQDACHIWKYYIIKYYKMLIIFTYNDRH